MLLFVIAVYELYYSIFYEDWVIFLSRYLKFFREPFFYYFLVVSIWFMSFCSYTSPLFYFDYSPDNNCFFTVGKAMMHGILPYRDVFEQKGPYVYLIHGIASLMSGRSLLGMFPFEVLSLLITMIVVYMIAGLYIHKSAAGIIAIFSPVFQLFHPYYTYGDTVESFLFPAMLMLIYSLLRADQENLKLSKAGWTIQGFLVGLTFLMKYTLLGGWIIFYIWIFIEYVTDKRYRDIQRLILWSLLGFLIAIVPWLIYFLVTHSLAAFIHVYFYENMHVYMLSDNSVFAKFLESLTIYSSFLRQDPLIFVCGFIGLIYLMFTNSIFKTWHGKALFVAMMISNAAFVVYGYHAGQVYQYYELAFFPYIVVPSVFLLIQLFKFYQFKITKVNESQIFIGSVLISLFLVLGVNNNILSSKIFPNNASVTLQSTTKPQQPAQIIFGNIMRQQSHGRPTLLNYGSIDMGFYTTSGALPTNYYFQNYNIAYNKAPQIMNSQNESIKKAKTQWVVVNTPAGKNIKQWRGTGSKKISAGNLNPGTKKISKVMLRNYRVVALHTQNFENTNVAYWLLKRKSAKPSD